MNTIIDGPRFLAATPRSDLTLDAVLPHVRSGREEQSAARCRADLTGLWPVVQHGIDEDLEQRRVLLRLLELLGCVRPGEPTQHLDEEAARGEADAVLVLAVQPAELPAPAMIQVFE